MPLNEKKNNGYRPQHLRKSKMTMKIVASL